MTEDYSALVDHASLWFENSLPASQNVSKFTINVAGVMLDKPDRPTRFHTFACLYPDRGTFVAMNTGQFHELSVSAPEIRRIILGYNPPERWIREQREAAALVVGPQTDDAQRWRIACTIAAQYGLPVGMFCFGHTAGDNLLSVYLCFVELAPPTRLMQEFRRHLSEPQRS